MPWPPESWPVMKFDQATGLCGGMAVPRAENPPESASFLKLGISPARIISPVITQSMPSKPSTMTLSSPSSGAVLLPQPLTGSRTRVARHAATPQLDRRRKRFVILCVISWGLPGDTSGGSLPGSWADAAQRDSDGGRLQRNPRRGIVVAGQASRKGPPPVTLRETAELIGRFPDARRLTSILASGKTGGAIIPIKGAAL